MAAILMAIATIIPSQKKNAACARLISSSILKNPGAWVAPGPQVHLPFELLTILVSLLPQPGGCGSALAELGGCRLDAEQGATPGSD